MVTRLGRRATRRSLQMLADQESVEQLRRGDLIARSISYAANGEFVPAYLLEQIAKVDERLASLAAIRAAATAHDAALTAKGRA